MRNTFKDTLIALARADKDIVVITPDMGYGVLDAFSAEFPDRFFNVGIAEQNAVGMAAGMALRGKKPYVYSIIPFVTMRCFEQVRVDVAYMETNVKLIGVGAGFEYGPLGATHHGTEDVSVMRALPNMVVCAPGDTFEMEHTMLASAATHSPMYIRIGRHNDGVINTTGKFELGRASIIEDGTDIAVIATGNMMPDARRFAEKLKAGGKSVALVSMHTIKPIDREVVLGFINKGMEIHTLEEHNVVGALGSAVAEVIAESGKGVKFIRHGIPDKFSHYVGSQKYIKGKFGLNF
ncbi:MAG: hypothetical protein LBL52_04395 [Rickettsiales bacterium]|jgi:transketolase|nr:hypothetical protein [Rickettsiales bacterium]